MVKTLGRDRIAGELGRGGMDDSWLSGSSSFTGFGAGWSGASFRSAKPLLSGSSPDAASNFISTYCKHFRKEQRPLR
jgi:hypothetical protein